MSTSVIILALTILAAIAAFIANEKDSKQKDNIEKIGTITKDLTAEVKKLSLINNTIAIENTNLSNQNINLTEKANELIVEVQKLATLSGELIKKVDTRTESQSAETALTGEFKFKRIEQFSNDKNFDIRIGKATIRTLSSELKNNGKASRVIYNGEPLYDMVLKGGNIFISLELYDLEGKWIADIENNIWTRNPNNTGRFNYDESGFEVIDNRGYTVFSIELLSDGNVSLRGYFYKKKANMIIIASDNGLLPLGINTPFGGLLQTVENEKINRVFEYSGNNWLGKRRAKENTYCIFF